MSANAATARKTLGVFETVLYTVVATIGIRWLAVAAAVGPSALPLWIFAFLVFYVPLAVATGELTARYSGGGSIYAWTRGTLGPLSGFVCAWFYWTSLFPYLAGLVYFLSGLLLTIAGADAHNGWLYFAVSIALTVVTTAVQLFGLRLGKWLTNLGGAGSWLLFFLIAAPAVWLLIKGTVATDFVHASYVPRLDFNTAILWGTMVFALCGTETVAFLREDLRGGMRTVIRVLAWLGAAMVAIYTLGTAAMLVILPQADLTRLSGLPDALTAAFHQVGFPAVAVFAIAFFALSQFGGITAWLGIGARLPVEAGIDSFLPPIFAKKNPRTGAPVASILLQGALCLLMVILSQTGSGAAAAYDFLVSMSVLTATIPYVYVFVAYLARHRWPHVADAWRPPGGPRTGIVLGVVGLISTLVAIACTMVPSATDTQPLNTFLKIVISTVVMLVVGLVLYWLAARRRSSVLMAQSP